jgi:hypothetical protein
VLDWDVTDWPEAALLLATGVDPGVPPAFTTKISNVGGVGVTGVHANAHPMFQVPPAMLKAELVQLPLCWVRGTSTVIGPVAWVAVVVDVELLVPEEAPAAVVEVEAEAEEDPLLGADVAGDEDPAAGGSL